VPEKTTVFNLITGGYAPTGGEIWFEGERVASANKSLKVHQLTQRGIARTFQNIRLFGDMSVEDNVRCAFSSRAGYGLASSLLRDGKYFGREAWIREEAGILLKIFGLEARKSTLARNLPMAISAAWKSRARWRPSPNCCCSMNRHRA
jgi:branched-chain amino acid transport system ATP-binding protein